MQSLRRMPALPCLCIFLAIAALASLAIDSAASRQMATKRRISQQLQQDIGQCAHLEGAKAVFCRQQAFHHAEVARSELRAQRHALRQGRRPRIAAHHSGGPAHCLASPPQPQPHAPCIGAVPASATS